MSDWKEPRTPEEAFARSMRAIDQIHDRERTLEADNVALKVAIREAKADRDELRRMLTKLLARILVGPDPDRLRADATALLAKYPYEEDSGADE